MDFFKIVDVWAGRADSEDRWLDYLRETITDDDEDPISEFAADQREPFYDHDFLYTEFSARPANLRERLRAVSSAATGAFDGWLASRDGDGPVNAVLMLFGEEVESPRDCDRPGIRLTYLGRFAAE